MPEFFDICEKYFKTSDIYKILGISKDATESQVRKAYHKVSLQVHPDRVEESDKKECTEKFKIVGKIHSILSDKDKRALYDETGDIGEEDYSERNWTKYWRLLFKKITLQDIRNFENKYKGSKEELEDLQKAYIEGEGDMDYILETVLCASLDDEARLKDLLQNMIDESEVPAFPKFTNETQAKIKRRKRKMEKEAEEAEQMKVEMGLGDSEADLFALIKKKQTGREQEMDSFYDSLAEKYGGKKKTSAKQSTPKTKKKRKKKSFIRRHFSMNRSNSNVQDDLPPPEHLISRTSDEDPEIPNITIPQISVQEEEDISPPPNVLKPELESVELRHSSADSRQLQCSSNFLNVPEFSQAKSVYHSSQHGFLGRGQVYNGSYQKLINEDVEEMLKDIPLDRQSSVILPILADRERNYFDLVRSGDVNLVKGFLQENPGFNINCIDFEGHSALHIAVINGDEAMVSFLLEQRRTEIGDCVLHAIRSGRQRIVILLLNYLSTYLPNLEFCGVPNSSDFSPDITPLILAAHYGHYEIIGMLLEREHKIIPPHHPRCFCKEVCQYARLNVYRALANSAYICHTSSDPILTAFKLCVELQQRGDIEEEFRSAYMKLAKEVKSFAVDIVKCCRTEEEIEILLSLSAGCDCPGQFLFPRLELAMDCYQKEFVAHPNVQHALINAWLGNWYQWRRKSDLAKALTVIPRIPLLPVMAIMCMFIPNSKSVKHWSLPINKMISSVASYLVFLVLIFIESNQDKKKQLRGPPQSGLEPVLILYVVSYIFSSIRLCMLQGPRRFFRHLWNWYDLINQMLFALTFLFWLAALINVNAYGNWDLERKYWHQFDPTLLAEGFFAVATILSFSKLLLLCQLNYYLGPLQVSLGKMTKDIAKFIALFIVIILSFSAGLCRLYHYYDGMVQEDSKSGSKVMQVSSFVNIEATVKTLFWAIFCMAPLESADVVIEDLPAHDGTSRKITNKHVFTETVGYIAFAVFEVLSVIVILNMLIAAITNTYKKVADNVHIEWTFGRTRVYLGYMSQTILPPPFNLLPTATGLSSMVEWCRVCVQPSNGRRARFSLSHLCYIEKEDQKRVQKEYPEVISQLVQRYFTEKEDTGMGSGNAINPNIDSLKQDISELRILLNENLTSRTS